MEAKSDQDIGGYDVQFVSEPPDSLVCLICTLVARVPQQMDCCGRVYCQLCLCKHLKDSNKCPHCRQVGNSFSDKRSNRETQALEIKCTHVKSDCEWIGELEKLDTHLQTCPYQLVQCPNGCKEEKELIRIPRRDLEEHVSRKCLLRKHKCQYCQEEGEYEERMSGHLDTCSGVSVDCPNEGCNKRYPRSNACSHADVCDYQKVACKYTEVGCKVRVLRKDIKEHEENDTLHLKTTIDTVCELKQSMIKLTLNKSHTVLMVPMMNELKPTPSFSTPSFYCKGYNIRLTVCIKLSDVSVYVHLQTGKFDNVLRWPFPGTVVIELLNQLEDRNHHQHRLTFPPEQKCSHRVLNETGNGGWGYPSFIPYSGVDYKPDKNCQYVKNGALIFRVSVEIPDYKPWLECDL